MTVQDSHIRRRRGETLPVPVVSWLHLCPCSFVVVVFVLPVESGVEEGPLKVKPVHVVWGVPVAVMVSLLNVEVAWIGGVVVQTVVSDTVATSRVGSSSPVLVVASGGMAAFVLGDGDVEHLPKYCAPLSG